MVSASFLGAMADPVRLMEGCSEDAVFCMGVVLQELPCIHAIFLDASMPGLTPDLYTAARHLARGNNAEKCTLSQAVASPGAT